MGKPYLPTAVIAGAIIADGVLAPHTHAHRFRHTFATWAIENDARELDVQYLLGHSTPAMVRRYSATYNFEKAARAHARWSPGDMLNGRSAADPTSV